MLRSRGMEDSNGKDSHGNWSQASIVASITDNKMVLHAE